MSDLVVCPHCEMEQRDCVNGGDPGPWWNGEDDTFKLKCDYCKETFWLSTNWSPKFETFKTEDEL